MLIHQLTEGSTTFEESHVKSSNLLHLESVLRTVEESSNVVGLFKPVITSNQSDVFGAPLVVDVVANGGALWFKVVARNALALPRIWEGKYRFFPNNQYRMTKNVFKTKT